MLAFSVYTNGKNIFKTSEERSNICCLNGLKVTNCVWIIAMHRFLFMIYGRVVNIYDSSRVSNLIHKNLLKINDNLFVNASVFAIKCM